MSCNNNETGGIRNILKVIAALQENAEERCEAISTCDKPFLGPNEHKRCFNTRPVMFFTDDSEPWEIPFDSECEEEEEEDHEEGKEHKKQKVSSVFRVEKVDDNIATCRVLVPKKHDPDDFRATNSFFTINIGCICAIKCLRDTFVELC